MTTKQYLKKLQDLQFEQALIEQKIQALRKKFVEECKHHTATYPWDYWRGNWTSCTRCGFTVQGSNCGALYNWPSQLKFPVVSKQYNRHQKDLDDAGPLMPLKVPRITERDLGTKYNSGEDNYRNNRRKK